MNGGFFFFVLIQDLTKTKIIFFNLLFLQVESNEASSIRIDWCDTNAELQKLCIKKENDKNQMAKKKENNMNMY